MTEGEFEQQIKGLEDRMFGLMLYQETSPGWVKKAQEASFNNIISRETKAIEDARKILEKAKSGIDVSFEINTFEFPIIIDEMKFRIDVMIKSYNSLFPDRPHNKRLSEKELLALQNDAMKRITLASQGVFPHILKKLARHSDIQTTMSYYTHVLHGDDVQAIDSLYRPQGKQ